jgi:hypothetical protein
MANTKTLDELIADLEDLRAELGGDAEVRIAYQPSYPRRGAIANVTAAGSDDPYDEDERAAGQDGDARFAWIALGEPPYDESPYSPRWAWGD